MRVNIYAVGDTLSIRELGKPFRINTKALATVLGQELQYISFHHHSIDPRTPQLQMLVSDKIIDLAAQMLSI
jgi:hypothetical protein